MSKKLIIVVFLAFGVFASAQVKNILLPNKNFRAKELFHNLNKTEDTLVLKCERTIYKVLIYNGDYDNTIKVNGNEVDIPLIDMPLGRFLIETILEDKRIIIVLLREYRDNEIVTVISDDLYEEKPNITIPSSGKTEQLGLMQNEAIEVEKLETLNQIVKKPRSYWVEYIISNGNSSSKTMRMASKSWADKLIKKNKIELLSSKGRNNKLTIWEVYDSSNFLRVKRLNDDLNEVSDSEYFNPEPYYTSKIESSEN